jgi:hypothetical protein
MLSKKQLNFVHVCLVLFDDPTCNAPEQSLWFDVVKGKPRPGTYKIEQGSAQLKGLNRNWFVVIQ